METLHPGGYANFLTLFLTLQLFFISAANSICLRSSSAQTSFQISLRWVLKRDHKHCPPCCFLMFTSPGFWWVCDVYIENISLHRCRLHTETMCQASGYFVVCYFFLTWLFFSTPFYNFVTQIEFPCKECFKVGDQCNFGCQTQVAPPPTWTSCQHRRVLCYFCRMCSPAPPTC